jgi:hypothetical protein
MKFCKEIMVITCFGLGLGCASAKPDIHYAEVVPQAITTALPVAPLAVAIAAPTPQAEPTTTARPLVFRVVVERGDTLWDISRKVYGTGFLWPLLCSNNLLQDCHMIEVGQILQLRDIDAVRGADNTPYLNDAYLTPSRGTSKK